ncbi:MAG: AAC(3) family N-acetyltransferase [Kiritimatiellae bacterium]|nr:AAC(3) family N-acetyltransferase [Kiritimatiellia bacterium]
MTKNEIVAGLRKLGLKKGDIVMVHSSLASLGRVTGGAQALLDAFLAVLGRDGTLVVPVFGKLGILTELVRQHPKSVVSVIPTGTVAALGKHARRICKDHWKADLVHEKDTPYVRIAEMGGYICLLGVDQDRNTSLHTAEAVLRLPYLKRTKEHTFDTPEGKVTKSWPFFPGPHRDFIGLDRAFRESGKMKVGRIGTAVARLIKSRDMLDIAVALGRRAPDFALCDNPNCADCVRQRADLNRARFRAEDATVAAATGLAGRYVPEMIENLQAAGIDAVELDIIQGQPVHALRPATLEKALAEFKEAGIAVTGLRSAAALDADSKMLDLAKACGIARLVVPLACRAAEVATSAAKQGLAVSFFNTALTTAQVGRVMRELEHAQPGARLTLSPAHFARLGEGPFSASTKARIRKYMDQLDIEDMTREGTPQALARGNAEIKELVSILRCAGFSGNFVLSTTNRFTGTLRDTAARFVGLLDTM